MNFPTPTSGHSHKGFLFNHWLCGVLIFLVAGCLSTAQAGTLAKLTIQPEKGDKVEVSFDSTPGMLYRLQRSTNINSVNQGNNQNWFFGDAVVADSTNTSVESTPRIIRR